MHRYSHIAILAATLLLLSPLAALDVDGGAGEYGFQMLQIPTGAAIAGAGGTGAAGANNALGFFQHPTAGLLNRTSAVSFSYTSWLFDTTMNTVAYSRHSGSKSFGVSMRYLDYGEFDAKDNVNQVIGEFHPMDMDMVLNFAYRITPTHYVGVNAHLLYEKIHTSSAFGGSADIGWTWLTPVDGLRAGLVARNIGGTSKMDKESIDLPHTFEGMVAKDQRVGTVDLTGEARLLKPADEDDIQASVGINARMFQMLDLRMGYKFNHDTESLSAGFGVSWKRLRVDYAYLPFDEEGLDDVHIFGLSFML